MSYVKIIAALVVLAPLASAGGLLPVNPILNGGFEIDTSTSAAGPVEPVIDECIGVGHQALVPLYSAWGDWVFNSANDPTSVDPASPSFLADATGYPLAYAGGYAAEPATAYACDPHYQDVARVNPAEKVDDPGFMWSNDPGTTFADANGDGDREVIIPRVPVEHDHNLWQSVATSTQAWSADFDAFAFTVESGAIPAGANVQVGLSLTPGYMQSPWVGIFWEGAVMFRANDMARDANGHVAMDPVAKGEIVCPGGYTPCLEFKAAYNAADADGKRTLLGQARIVQTSFWAFSGGVGPVVLDDVAYVGAKTAVETPPSPNPGA